MKLIAYYSIYNEADFIQESLASIYNHVDQIIIIEGAWRETYEVNGHMRSTDGTIEKVGKFPDPACKIIYREHNESDQLAQRNALWRHLWGRCSTNEDVCLLLVDGDEVYSEKEIKKVRAIAETDIIEAAYTIDSLTFVNDLYTYCPIRFPRFWRLKYSSIYQFVEPNTLTKDNKLFDKKIDLDITYHHYSYCHSTERFIEKKRERTKKHGLFSWELREGLVQKDGVNFLRFGGKHPETMRDHPLIGIEKHKQKMKPEVIVYVEHSGIGNLVLATPMLKAIRNTKPDAHIYVVAWKRSYRILEGISFIDSIIAIDEQGQMNQLPDKIDHLIISPVGSLGNVVSWLQQRSANVLRLQVGSPWTKHEADYKLTFAKQLGWRGKTPSCEVCVHPYNLEKVDKHLQFFRGKPLIAINAAYLKNEHWKLKHWGNEKFATLIDKLQAIYEDHCFIFVGSKDDRDDAHDIMEKTSETFYDYMINLCGFSSDIKDTAAILSLCDLCIGNDGGIQHIAAGVGTPTVTIFTFTNPIKNRPFGPEHSIVMNPCENRLSCQHGLWSKCQENGCLDVPVEKVLEHIKNNL